VSLGDGQQPLVPLEQAIEGLLELVVQPERSEEVTLEKAAGRVLAVPVHAHMDVPAWNNSAMDGYALRAADLPADGGDLPLAGRTAAGSSPPDLVTGQAVRIFTGAPLPTGADTVVAQEACVARGSQVSLPPVTRGSHVRLRGEDVGAGDLLLSAGSYLRAPEIGLLASQGIGRVMVYQPLRVALLCSGNELREPGQPLQHGQIFNTNRYTLTAVLEGWGCEVIAYPTMPDDLSATCDQLLQASQNADVLVSSGGVSVGEEDHLKAAIGRLGQLALWRIAIQPGKPLAFGRVGDKPWLGLPGNPVAALVTLLMVARPWLLRSQGRACWQTRAQQMPAGFDWPSPKPRRQFLRARLTEDPLKPELVLHPHQGSAMLSAASWADGLAEVVENRVLRRGDLVRYWSYAQLLN